jgi:hypothetical protein
MPFYNNTKQIKNSTMIKGPARFLFYLTHLQTLLDKAAKQKNPALWLYKNDARTPLFMLEGLAKLYISVNNPKKFTKLKAQFKLLEDTLGAIDYYDNIAKDISVNKKIPATITSYLQAQTREKIQSLNEILVEKEWLSARGIRIKKIQKKLAKADWLDEEPEINAINEFYGNSIYAISEFIQNDKLHFSNIEADVHELRRKLRWLSIYPQALRGSIQLSTNKRMPKHLAKYLTKEITSSPYNKMPDAGDATYFLLLEQNYFYALSWMIDALGKIKDKGLHVVAVKEALQQTTELTDADALKKAYQLLGTKQPKLEQLLVEAEKICQNYFGELNLENLVFGMGSVK